MSSDRDWAKCQIINLQVKFLHHRTQKGVDIRLKYHRHNCAIMTLSVKDGLNSREYWSTIDRQVNSKVH